jgi:hypothetical protein
MFGAHRESQSLQGHFCGGLGTESTAILSKNGAPGFRANQKLGIVVVNLASSGECQMNRERNGMTQAPQACAMALCATLCLFLSSAPADAKPTIVTFDPAGSIATFARSVNDNGAIAGFWVDPKHNFTDAFERAPDGTIRTLHHHGSTVTAAYAIDSGRLSRFSMEFGRSD